MAFNPVISQDIDMATLFSALPRPKFLTNKVSIRAEALYA